MINKLLLTVYVKFTADDWIKYSSFVRSEDAVSKRKFYPLIKVISKYREDPDSMKQLSSEKIFRIAYGKKYTRQTILNRQTELLGVTRKFLRYSAVEKNRLVSETLYSQELISRGLLGLYRKDFSDAEEIYRKHIFTEEAYAQTKEIVLAAGSYLQMKKEVRPAMEKFFLYSRLLLADMLCSIYRTGQELQIQLYSGIDFGYNPVLEYLDSDEHEKFFEGLEKRKDVIFVLPLLRYYLFMAFRGNDGEKFIGKAESLFFREEKKFSENFRTEMYRMIMSYYIVKANRGEHKYYENLYRLYRRKLENNLVSDIRIYNYPANVFREYVLTGIKVKKYGWTESVIRKYSRLLPEALRDDEMNLAYVRLNFARREYREMLKRLDGYKSRNEMHHLDSLRFRLAGCYELGMYEEAYFEVDRIKHFLKYNRKKISEKHSAPFRVFLNMVMKLLNYRANPYGKDPELIVHEIESPKKNYLMREWVLEKARELSKIKP